MEQWMYDIVNRLEIENITSIKYYAEKDVIVTILKQPVSTEKAKEESKLGKKCTYLLDNVEIDLSSMLLLRTPLANRIKPKVDAPKIAKKIHKPVAPHA